MHQLLDAVRGILFLGTPHAGSDLAKWGMILTGMVKLFRKANREIVRPLEPCSTELAYIQQEFHTMLDSRRKNGQEMEIFCFYEEYGYTGIGHVSLSESPRDRGLVDSELKLNDIDCPQAFSNPVWLY